MLTFWNNLHVSSPKSTAINFSWTKDMNSYRRRPVELVTISILVFCLASANNGASYLDSVSDDTLPMVRATRWLLNLRNAEFHWGRLANSQVLLALSRSNVNTSHPEFQLAIKQLDIDFLLNRLRHGDLELYSDRLVPHAVALTSLCRSPIHYYDYDLLDGLLDHRRDTDNFSFASELLAVCGGDGTILRTHIRRLVRLLNPKLWMGPTVSIDTASMLLMATGCVAQYHSHEYILPFADQLVSLVISKQQDDGSFNNNIVTTALAIQALQIKGLMVGVNETVGKAVKWLESMQHEDGSFDSDLLATTEAMLALSPMGGRAFVHLNLCNQTDTVDVTAHTSSQITLQITVLAGQPEVFYRQSFHLKVPVNSTIYDALKRAEADGLLRFESREYSFGHYVVSISNIAETESGNRWMVYVIPADINHAKPDKKFLLKTAVSSYKPKDGDRIFFWYQPIQQH